MSNYKRCDCCGQLKSEDDLEEVTIVIKKCRDCDLSKSPIIQGDMNAKPVLKSLDGQGDTKPFNAYRNTPSSVANVFNPPPLD
jgi:hypothetical protein